MTWIPSVSGAVIELVDPVPEQVNFEELAWSLAHLNRYSGHPRKTVSVGLHLLIGGELTPEHLKAKWYLHDGHESRTGEHTSTAKEAIEVYARRRFGDDGAAIVRAARLEFEAAHTVAIHHAAGVPLPTADERKLLKQLDLVTLATERRDFCAEQRRPWRIDEEGITASPKACRWKPADKVADELFAKFKRHFPALKSHGGRASY